MAIGFPTKANWAAGDVLTASAMDDLAGTVNLLNPTAKGNLISASAANTVALLAVGNNGDTIVADSSTSTGLRYQATFAAGKNAVINGGFDVWQRGTSIGPISSVSQYTADRFYAYLGATPFTISRQSTNDTTNVPYLQYCLRMQRTAGNTGTNVSNLYSAIESANSIPLSGKTVTLSFIARAGVNFSSTNLGVAIYSGTGTDQALPAFTGQTTVANLNQVLTTGWVKYSITGTVAGTATQLGIGFTYTPTGTAGANDYFEVTGIQLEIASVATAFTRTGGSIQGELAACQRYFFRTGYANNGYEPFSAGLCISTTQALIASVLPFQMRVTPSVSYSSTVGNFNVRTAANTLLSLTAIAQDSASPWNVFHKITVTAGLVAGNATLMNVGASGPCYIDYNSEL